MDIIMERLNPRQLKDLLKYSIIRKEDIIKLKKVMNNSKHIVLIARKDTEICGFIHAKCFKHTAYIENIILLDKFQGTGISQKLYDSVLSVMKQRNIKKIKLYVYPHKKRAINFWRKLGFLLKNEAKDNKGRKLFIMERIN